MRIAPRLAPLVLALAGGVMPLAAQQVLRTVPTQELYAEARVL